MRFPSFRYRLALLSSFATILSVMSPASLQAQYGERNPCQIVVQLYIGSLLKPATAGFTVQLMDRFGSFEAEAHTDTTGRVVFQTQTVTKRLRIFGPGVEETTEVVEIEPVESRKMVNLVARPKDTGPDLSSLPVGKPIPALRLSAPEKAQKEFRKGSDALAKKDWAEARKHFESAIATYADYDVAYNGLGATLMAQGDSKSARPAFEKAISLNADFAEAYRNLARISLAERNYEELDNLLVRSLSVDPLNAWALAYSAYAELQLHKFDDALLHARKAHEQEHKGLASVHVVAGLALEATDRAAEAMAEYRTYLIEDPTGRDAARAKSKIAELESKAPQ